MSRQRLRREDTLALAHELRTPLTSLALATGLLRDERAGPLAPRQKELLESATRDVDRLLALVDGALRIDRLGSYAGPLERADVDLAAVVERVLPPLRTQAVARGAALVERLEPGAVVRADGAKLGWIAASLVGNALRFTPRGGRVDVSVEPRGRRCLLRVSDSGPGIPRERRRAIVAREAGGTLFLVREIVGAHLGELRLWSREGQGSTFTVVLPSAPSKEPT